MWILFLAQKKSPVWYALGGLICLAVVFLVLFRFSSGPKPVVVE